jgi:choline dehydrogenase-like flavoprotein
MLGARISGTSLDASVFPNNVSGNIVSSVYATAEKAADIIKADHS